MFTVPLILGIFNIASVVSIKSNITMTWWIRMDVE
jgi:hypothetical protein